MAGRPQKYSDADLIQNLKDIAAKVGTTALQSKHITSENGALCSLPTFCNRFGSWNKAKVAAGLDATTRGRQAGQKVAAEKKVSNPVPVVAKTTPKTRKVAVATTAPAVPATEDFTVENIVNGGTVIAQKAAKQKQAGKRIHRLIQQKGFIQAQSDMLYGNRQIGYLEMKEWVAAGLTEIQAGRI